MFNRNTKVETFNGNIQINRYDAEGLRHEMEENGKLVSFIFRGPEIVTEETKEDKIRYIRTGELLASDAECARTYYHYAADEMGSITHVVDSEEGNVLNHYEYDAWGNLTVCEEKAENRFRFNGQQYDPISQQYYLRARYYNPVIGRFTQEDSYREDGLNLYAYCRNNPVYYVDPSGNICETRAKDIMGKLDSNQATRSEQKKLAAYLRNKDRNGGLTTAERSALNKVDGYTYLNRYDNQTYFKSAPEGYYQDSTGRWHGPDGKYASNADVGLRQESKKVSKSGSNSVETPINSGNSKPKDTATPNSIYEQLNSDGTVKSRAFYDQNGNEFSRQDFDHPHFDKKTQQYYQPHEHNYSYNEKGQRNGKSDGPLPPDYSNQPTK